jgi:hypothetical protein
LEAEVAITEVETREYWLRNRVMDNCLTWFFLECVAPRFLWKTSSVIPDPSQELDDDLLPGVNVYKWTGKNDYIALCEPDFLSLGGG